MKIPLDTDAYDDNLGQVQFLLVRFAGVLREASEEFGGIDLRNAVNALQLAEALAQPRDVIEVEFDDDDD